MLSAYCKLEIFVPESHLEAVRAALLSVDAGHIGAYDGCLSYGPVTSCWRPLPGTSPYLGRVGELGRAPELEVEGTSRSGDLSRTISAVKKVHPYEEPVINAIPLLATGLGE